MQNQTKSILIPTVFKSGVRRRREEWGEIRQIEMAEVSKNKVGLMGDMQDP